MNPGAARRIVDAAGDLRGRGVVEVGPGRGALTLLLAERAARVVALEIDEDLAAELTPRLPEGRVEIRMQDAVAADWSALAGELPGPVALVANLPYESGTAILSRWLAASAADPRLDPAVVMLQREVAERVGAPPSTKAYGAFGVLAQATHRVKTVLDVAPGSFRPVPQVQSRVIRLDRLATPLFPPEERKQVESFVHAAFSQRRKQLAVVLAGFRDRSREQWQQRLAEAGHAVTARAEELNPAELVAMSRDSS